MNKLKKTVLSLGLVALGIVLATGTIYVKGLWEGTPVNDGSMDSINKLDERFDDILDENLRLIELSTSDQTVIDNYKEQVRQMRETIREYELLIHGRDERIVTLKEDILIRDNQIKDLSERLADLQSQLDVAYDEAVVINSRLEEMVEKYVGK